MEITNLTVKYGEKTVFENFNLTLQDDKITCLLGASGVGKSTLLSAISGNVAYTGKITGANTLSYIFQENRLIENVTVEKNLDLVLRSITKDKFTRKKIIDNVLKLVEMENCKDLFPRELSGGMASRISMARGFIYPSNTLLMDETFKGLDTALKQRLIKAFLNLYNENKRTIVFVTHSIDEALLLADEVFVLKGSPCEVSFSLTIAKNQQDRKLTDDELDKARKQLLENLID